MKPTEAPWDTYSPPPLVAVETSQAKTHGDFTAILVSEPSFFPQGQYM